MTKKILEAKVENLNGFYEMNNTNGFDLEYAYGKVKLVKKCGCGYENITPYGTKTEVANVIDSLITVKAILNRDAK